MYLPESHAEGKRSEVEAFIFRSMPMLACRSCDTMPGIETEKILLTRT